MTTIAATMSIACCPCDCCALSAVPAKSPRTLVGMPMLASAWLIAARASPRLAPSARLNEIVVASSPSWWLTEVGVESSTKRATAVSGTRLVALLLSTLPVEAFFSAGLADTGSVGAAGDRRGLRRRLRRSPPGRR